MSTYSREREFATRIAREAGAVVLSMFGGTHTVSRKEDASPVTEADFASSRLIQEALGAMFPEHTILCEELPGAASHVIGKEPTWVIDPLDGTSNFISGIPLFGVALALVVGGQTQLGIIFDPVHDELFVAERGEGTFLNDIACTVSTQPSTKGGMLFAGRGYSHEDHERHGRIIFALEQETTYFRRLGCASLMLASVACGRADSVILTGNSPWDILPGALLIHEAGGRLTDYCGDAWDLTRPDLVATNGQLHDELVSITRTQDSRCL